MFPVRPKQHAYEHLVLDYACFVNARYTQTLLDEDLMRRVKAVAISVHPQSYARRALEHYAMGLALRWTRDL